MSRVIRVTREIRVMKKSGVTRANRGNIVIRVTGIIRGTTVSSVTRVIRVTGDQASGFS